LERLGRFPSLDAALGSLPRLIIFALSKHVFDHSPQIRFLRRNVDRT
jgi:hypothetical protein